MPNLPVIKTCDCQCEGLAPEVNLTFSGIIECPPPFSGREPIELPDGLYTLTLTTSDGYTFWDQDRDLFFRMNCSPDGFGISVEYVRDDYNPPFLFTSFGNEENVEFPNSANYDMCYQSHENDPVYFGYGGTVSYEFVWGNN